MMKRLLDVLLSSTLLVALAPVFLVLTTFIRFSAGAPALYWSQRVGAGNRLFSMPKFRTMRQDTPQMATDLLSDPTTFLIRGGTFIRKTSLDELPQLWSVLIGDMSLVGPRPALFNQKDLIQARTDAGVHELLPGITGLAQIRGRDDLSLDEKVAYDRAYLRQLGFTTDLNILLRTALQVVMPRGVKH